MHPKNRRIQLVHEKQRLEQELRDIETTIREMTKELPVMELIQQMCDNKQKIAHIEEELSRDTQGR